MAINFKDKRSKGLFATIAQAGHYVELRDGEWVTDDESEVQIIIDNYDESQAPLESLNPIQFQWMLAFTGLEDVWELVKQYLKEHDRATYAYVRAQEVQVQYRFEVTMSQISQLAPVISSVAADYDVSEPAIRAAWILALDVDL